MDTSIVSPFLTHSVQIYRLQYLGHSFEALTLALILPALFPSLLIWWTLSADEKVNHVSFTKTGKFYRKPRSMKMACGSSTKQLTCVYILVLAFCFVLFFFIVGQ